MLVMALAVGSLLVVGVPLPARAANVSLSLFGSSTSGWGNTSSSITEPGPTLVVHQGDVVTITLTSADGFPHQFLIDYNGNGVNDAGEPMSAAFSSTTTFSFTAGTAGTFVYFCMVHPTAMRGTFVVLASGGTMSPPPSSSPTSGGSNTTLLVLGGVIVVALVAGVAILVSRRKR